jgi:ParB-like chromosome segregation protein Spo0J
MRAAMKRGEKLPPIVVTQDGYIVDGNTRVTAASRNQYPTIQAVILDVKYEGCTQSESRRLWSLGAAFNARHGKGIDREELRRAVEQIGADPSYTATRIAALIGVTDSVQGMLAEKRAHARAEALGLSPNGSVSASRLKALGRQSEHLNDEPFKELFTLVQDTGMGDGEIRDVVKRARETKSDSGALGVFATERQARRDQISEYKASGKAVPPNAAKLRQRLGFILGYEANPRELLEHNPALVKDYIDVLERSIIVLQKVVEAQEA